jgi:hypothetical protein
VTLSGATLVPTQPIEWLILCEPSDPAGDWLRDGLRQRGFDSVQLITIDELVYSSSISHSIDSAGVRTEIMLSDGRFVGPHLRGTVNRARYLPFRHLEFADAVDRDYAMQELYALYASILSSLPGKVVNQGTARGLCGPMLHSSEWEVAAARAGLRVQYRCYPPSAVSLIRPIESLHLLVVGSEVVPIPDASSYSVRRSVHIPIELSDRCRALAAAQGFEMLQIDFSRIGDDWLFCGVDCFPDVRQGGNAMLDALGRWLS